MNPAPQPPAAATPAPEPRAPIHLHIDRLVVEGLPVDWRQSATLQAAVETELARLFTRDAFAPASSRAEPAATGGTIRLAATSAPRTIGREIGRQVHAAVRHTGLSTAPQTRETGGAR